MLRRRLPLLVLPALVAALVPMGVGAQVPEKAVPVPAVQPKIDEILAPLFGVPSIVEDGSELVVELDAESVSSPQETDAVLRPSFGAVREPTELDRLDVRSDEPSELWPDRQVHRLTFRVPELAPGSFVEDLYDLHVEWADDGDVQPRAVKVVEITPSEPRFVILADPSVGDPRPIQEGAEDLVAGDVDSMANKTTETIGPPPWEPLAKAIEEINLASPDFVLVAGDLTFGLYPNAANYEYELAWQMLSELRVPTYMTPGNHDLYHFDYDDTDRPPTTDGKVLWHQYFAPLHYAVDVGDDLHIVSIDTYDWPDPERPPVDLESGEIRSGGYVSDEQLAWLADDLRGWRAEQPDGSIVTFGHHDPSWMARRHPWPGANRLELRDLLAEVDAGAHFAGHTHDDRIARYHAGNVVETNGNNEFPRGELHYVRRDDTLDPGWTQEELADIVRDPVHGPVFVNTTTAASGLKGADWGLGIWWGYRLGTLRTVDGGYDPADFGYPVTAELLEAHAERPENYNANHSSLGVFSQPTYFLEERRDGGAVTITSRLLTDLEAVVPVSLEGSGEVRVSGGQLLRTRTDGEHTDVWIAVTVPADETIVVEASLDSD